MQKAKAKPLVVKGFQFHCGALAEHSRWGWPGQCHGVRWVASETYDGARWLIRKLKWLELRAHALEGQRIWLCRLHAEQYRTGKPVKLITGSDAINGRKHQPKRTVAKPTLAEKLGLRLADHDYHQANLSQNEMQQLP